MVDASHFELLDIVNDGANVSFVGRIDGSPAIMYARHPIADEESLEHYISKKHTIIEENDIYQTGEATVEQELSYTLVCPASEKELESLKTGHRYVAETYDEYVARRPLIAAGRVDRLLAEPGCREKAKTYFENDEFLVVADEDWSGGLDVLSLVLIVKDAKYVTLRDIDSIELVGRARRTAMDLCEESGIDPSLVVIYCDARPSGRHLHFNIRSIAVNCFSFPLQGWLVLMDDLLRNLSYSIDYYKQDVFFLSRTV